MVLLISVSLISSIYNVQKYKVAQKKGEIWENVSLTYPASTSSSKSAHFHRQPPNLPSLWSFSTWVFLFFFQSFIEKKKKNQTDSVWHTNVYRLSLLMDVTLETTHSAQTGEPLSLVSGFRSPRRKEEKASLGVAVTPRNIREEKKSAFAFSAVQSTRMPPLQTHTPPLFYFWCLL